MILTEAELKEFNDNHSVETLDLLYITAAQEIIEGYLNYPIEAAEYTEREYSGDGSGVLFLGMKPINTITEISIDDEDPIEDLDEVKIGADGWILYPAGFTAGVYNIKISFTAGYAAAAIPAVMKLTALRIAGILQKEGGGNIGISSVTDPASGSRTYQEIKFNKYLCLLDKYKSTYQDR